MLSYLLSQFLIKIITSITIKRFQKNIRTQQLINDDNNFFDSVIMLRFVKTKVAKEEFYDAKRKVFDWIFR